MCVFPSSIVVTLANELTLGSWLVSDYIVGCVCVRVCKNIHSIERHLGDDLGPSNMEPVAPRGRVTSVSHTECRARPEGPRLWNPSRAPPRLLCCLHLSSLSSGTLTFSSFLGKVSCRCPARSVVSWMPCSSVGATAPLGRACQGPGGFVCSVREMVGYGVH